MEFITELLPYVGSGVSIVNIVILIYLRNLEKKLQADAEQLKEIEKDLNIRLRRIEFFLDKKFSFSSLPNGYK